MSVYWKVDHFLDWVKIRIIKVSEKPQDSRPQNLFSADARGILEIKRNENKLILKANYKEWGTSRSRRIKDAK